MVCDTRLKPKQTITQRKDEIRRAVDQLNAGLAAGRIKAKIGPQGALAFEGWVEGQRDGITDNCAYRRLMTTGSVAARMAIQRAEQLSGRPVNKQVIGSGVHSHDGGTTWHGGHKHK